ncbi:Polygalacturonase inhibitor-like protein [Drosera capensis]
MEHPSLLYLSLLLVASAAAGELCNPDDKKVLLQIKASFNNTELLASWQSTTDCCTDWYQVQCDPTTNRIISLTIFDGELHGQIPPIVGELPFLQVLEFRDLTSISGPIPSTISKLTKLQQLRLAFLNLTGAIPPIFDNLKELNFIELSSNALTGSIPSSIGNLTKLNAVRLDHNLLTGRIPDSFGSFSGIIPQLFLSNNLLQGLVPATLGSLNFSVIDFSSNQLTGDASFLFGKNKDLLMIDLSHNSFEFDFTKVEFPVGLTNLDVNHNRIYGNLPESLTSLNLQLLNVSHNNLCGRIPVGGDLQSFDQSSYSHNRCLCGAPLAVACA